MKAIVCVLAVVAATCYAYGGDYAGGHGYSGDYGHGAAPAAQQIVEIVQPQGSDQVIYGHGAGGAVGSNVIQQQPEFEIIKVIHRQDVRQQSNVNTIQLIRDQQTNGDAVAAAGDYTDDDNGDYSGGNNLGDAFETLNSLKAFGAFSGNGGRLNSYGVPIARTWPQVQSA